MSTKTTLLLSQVLGVIFLVCMSLRSWTGRGAFATGGIVCALLSFGFLYYAWFRESELGDRSQTLSPRYIALVLCGLALWVAIIFFRAFAH